MKRKTVIGLLFWLLAVTGFSQPVQIGRFEHEQRYSEDGFTIIPLRQDGLALVRDMNKIEKGRSRWKLEVLDTLLKSTWSTELLMETKMLLAGYEYLPGTLVLLYREGQFDLHKFELVTLNLRDHTVANKKVNFEVTFTLSHFTMAGKTAVFGGEINSEPAVMLFNPTDDRPKVLPGLFVRNQFLLDVRMNQNESFNVLLVEQRDRDDKKLILRTFDENGDVLMEDRIRVDGNIQIHSGITSTLERDELVIVGTYGESGNKASSGLYTVVADPFTDQKITTIDFASIPHFLDYLGKRKSEKQLSKAQERKQKGLPPDYMAHVLPVRLEERPDGFYLLAEMFYPQSTITPYPQFGYPPNYSPYAYNYPYGAGYPPISDRRAYGGRFYQNPSALSNQVTSDVRMVESVVVQFDQRGQARKALSIKLDSRQSSNDQLSDFIVKGDSIWIGYKKKSSILYQKEQTEVEGTEESETPKIELSAMEGTVLRENEDSGAIRYWFGTSFYVWGFQTIKKTDGAHRQVFYVTRLAIR